VGFYTSIQRQLFGKIISLIVGLLQMSMVGIKDLLVPKYYENKIRLGNKSDGGYVVSADHLTDRLISLGCDNLTKFEEDYLVRAPDSSVVIYDGTSKCDLSDKDDRVTFHNKNIYSISELDMSKPCMVQMDIEGCELDFFTDNHDKMDMINQLVLEIHFHEEKYPEFPIKGSIDKWVELLKLFNDRFSLIHIHVNDNGIAQRRPLFCGVYDLLELTYIKKDDSLKKETRHFPLDGLDYPNGYNINPRIDWWL
jgi:hypothetical protein